uniref:Uncharacterized protein n=1 Tax=Octopus bimaculoides TaxID=37653 RepID=A0A0L8FU91_OCTBM
MLSLIHGKTFLISLHTMMNISILSFLHLGHVLVGMFMNIMKEQFLIENTIIGSNVTNVNIDMVL